MKLLSYLLILSLFSIGYTIDLPPFLDVCAKNEPNMLDCLQRVCEKLKPHLATGVPEFNIPCLEPLEVNEMITENGKGLNLTTSDVKAWGCTDFFITDANIDLDKQLYEFFIDLPSLITESRYNVSGRILMMPVVGEGPVQANVSNCKVKVVLRGELYNRDRDTYLRFTEMILKIKIGGGTVKIDNLFNGDKILNKVANDAVNRNLDTFVDDLMPILEKSLSKVLLSFANSIVEPFTYKQLFP